MKGKLKFAFSGSDARAVTEMLIRNGVPGMGQPSEATVDGSEVPASPGWLDRAFDTMKDSAAAWWDTEKGAGFWSAGVDAPTKVTRDDTECSPWPWLEMLRSIPFEVCSAGSQHQSRWRKLPGYERYGFGDMHWNHGWMCAFKGRGHERLVSRRWLLSGDWYLYRDEDCDLSVVVFHDPEADSATALEQAIPNHRRMGISSVGGYIQSSPWPYDHELSGVYDPRTRTLRIVVLGREVAESEMTDAAMFRHEHRNDQEQPVDNVAFVFVDQTEAAAHLKGLWLRELECWAIVEGVETRLDNRYVPPKLEQSEWVAKLHAERSGARQRLI